GLCWWAQAPRPQARRSGPRATTVRRSARWGVPVAPCQRRRGAWASAGASWRKQRGGRTLSPGLRLAKVVSPTARPTAHPVCGRGGGAPHAHEQGTSHVPVLRRGRVAVLGGAFPRAVEEALHPPEVPEAPPLGHWAAASRVPPTGTGGKVRRSERPKPPKRGEPGSCSPARTRRQKA